MSYCKQEGKDKIIFVTKEDHEAPSNAELVADDPNDPYEEHGLIMPNGDINWNCPCLGGMASGPCGQQFKEAFSCFHYSKEEVKGSECLENFRNMQECMQKFPELYPQEDDEPPKKAAAEGPTSEEEAAASTTTTTTTDTDSGSASASAPPAPAEAESAPPAPAEVSALSDETLAAASPSAS